MTSRDTARRESAARVAFRALEPRGLLPVLSVGGIKRA